MAEQRTNGKKEKKRRGDIFIPAGLFLGFGMGVIGFLKAIVWPAFLVHGLLKFLGM